MTTAEELRQLQAKRAATERLGVGMKDRLAAIDARIAELSRGR